MFKWEYECGEMVTVRFNSNEKVPNLGAKKYDGTVHRITKEVNYGAYGTMYELEGCVSDQGVPYTFTTADFEVVK